MTVWTERHAERARGYARLGWSDRKIAIEILVGRSTLLYHMRRELDGLRPPKPIAQQRPLNGWEEKALSLAKEQLAMQISIAKTEAKDPRTRAYKGHPGDIDPADIPSPQARTVYQGQTQYGPERSLRLVRPPSAGQTKKHPPPGQTRGQ